MGRIVLALLLAVLWSIPALAAGPRTVQIALVVDGPSERSAAFRALVRREISLLLETDAKVELSEHTGEWTGPSVERVIDKVLADRAIDLVVALNPLGSNALARRSRLSKPALAAIVVDPQLQGVPFRRGTSGKRNLAYLSWSWSPAGDIATFKDLVDFEHLAFLANRHFLEAVPDLVDKIRGDLAELAPNVQIIPVDTDVAATLAALHADTDAVYVGPLLQLDATQFQRLSEGLIAKRLPSFSLIGETEVAQGILAATARQTDSLQLARKLALTVQRLLIFREDAASLPVAFSRGQQLTINMTTAKAIGFHPSWRVLTEAELIRDEQASDDGEALTLDAVIRGALANNLDLQAATLGVAASHENIRLARSNLLPQVSLSVAGQWIDADRASASFGSNPERVLTLGGEISQVVYSEAAWANLDAQKSLQRAQAFGRDSVALDTVRDAGVAYLNVVRAKTLEAINRENVKRTRSNHKLAQTRLRIGVGTIADVHRLEAELANGRSDVINANAQRNVAEIALNRILGRPLEASFSTAEAAIGDSTFVMNPRLTKSLDDPWSFRVFREFIAAEALALSPEVGQLDATIDAQERLVAAAQRAYWIPDVIAKLSVTQLLTKGGAGSEGADLGIPNVSFPESDDTIWTAQLALSLPLFEGTRRYAEADQARLTLRQLQTQRAATHQRIEQRVRSAIHQLGYRRAAIQLAKTAAVAARKNLDIVTDAYAQGSVSIPTLLDAQQASFVGEQFSANAVADFLVAAIEAYRAFGAYPFMSDEAERDAFVDRFEAFLDAARSDGHRYP